MNKHIFNDKKILIASHNTGKVREIKVLLKPLKIKILSASDFNLNEPVENGLSFEENALIKSSYASKITGIPSLSDDSGICFSDLNNEPGVLFTENRNEDIYVFFLSNSEFSFLDMT